MSGCTIEKHDMLDLLTEELSQEGMKNTCQICTLTTGFVGNLRQHICGLSTRAHATVPRVCTLVLYNHALYVYEDSAAT